MSLGVRLDALGFFATANDVRRGYLTTEEVAFRLRRDAPKRTNQAACLELAAELDNSEATA